jgi:hypothetical protein
VEAAAVLLSRRLIVRLARGQRPDGAGQRGQLNAAVREGRSGG